MCSSVEECRGGSRAIPYIPSPLVIIGFELTTLCDLSGLTNALPAFRNRRIKDIQHTTQFGRG